MFDAEVINDETIGRSYIFLTRPGGAAPCRLRVVDRSDDGGHRIVFDSWWLQEALLLSEPTVAAAAS